MSTETPIEPSQNNLQTPPWTPATRVVFRFCFVYFGLFCLTTQIVTSLFSPSQGEVIPDPGTLWPMRQLVFWIAAHLFHIAAPLSAGGNSGSGDNAFGWVLAFCLLVIAFLAATIWSLLDRQRQNYNTLQKWFKLFIRFSLAGQMLNYGMAKAIPLQMPYPSLTALLEHFGNFSPMGVLWSYMGASPAYEMFAGCAEVLGGLLLILPRTATFGALVCLAEMIQVFTLNMTYDVPVKLFAFHLVLLSLVLLAPDFQRLANFFLLNRPAESSLEVSFFGTRRANRTVLIAQILLGLWLLVMNVGYARKMWYEYGGGRTVSPLYGIWEVSQFSIDGQLHPPLLTDPDRWRRVIFDFPNYLAFQRMDESFSGYFARINVNDKTVALTKRGNKNWKANLTFERAGRDRLTLDGQMDGHKVQMQLQLIDRNTFLLVNRGFHWIQEQAFNR